MWSHSDRHRRGAPGKRGAAAGRPVSGPVVVVLHRVADWNDAFPPTVGAPVAGFRATSWKRFLAAPERFDEAAAVVCQLPADPGGDAAAALIAWRDRVEAPLIAFSADRHEEAARVARAIDIATHLHTPFPRQGLLALLAREEEWLRLHRRWREARLLLWSEHRKLMVMKDVSAAANTELNPDRVIRIVIEKARAILPFRSWSLYLVREVKNELVRWQAATADDGVGLQVSDVIPRWVVRRQEPLILKCRDGMIEGYAFWKEAIGRAVQSILCIPLRSRGRIIGALQLVNRQEGSGFTIQEQELLQSLLEPASIAIENALLFRRSEEISLTDDLTGLYNSRYLHNTLHREVERSRRHRHQVSLIFLDLDGFKSINDRHGHMAGSRALIEVGQVIRDTVRSEDTVSRFGGDEFTVILPETGAEGATIIAERIRQRIESTVLLRELGFEAQVTASLGVATFPDHGATKDDLIARADTAMYVVKGRDKNAVEVAA